mgnify:CR=1 FL=1
MNKFDIKPINDNRILLHSNIYNSRRRESCLIFFPDPAGQDPFLTEGYIIISSVASYAFGCHHGLLDQGGDPSRYPPLCTA